MLSVPSNLRVDTACTSPFASPYVLSVPSNLRVDTACTSPFASPYVLSVPSNSRVDTALVLGCWLKNEKHAVSTFKFKDRCSPHHTDGPAVSTFNFKGRYSPGNFLLMSGWLSAPSILRVDAAWHGASHSMAGCQYLQIQG